jgi:hypothetical protein
MIHRISLQDFAKSRTIGIRALAVPIRYEAEMALKEGQDVVFDFSGVGVTQSFADELIGALILQSGPTVLSKIVFKGCSDDVRTILRFVTADRSEQFHQAVVRSRSFRNSRSSAEHVCQA